MTLENVIQTFFLVLVQTAAAQDRLAFVGESASLTCQVTTSFSQFVWIKDSTTLATGPPDVVLSEQNRISLSVPTYGVRQLNINDVRKYDAGSYVCHVTLTDGSQLVSASQLSVEDRLGKDDITTTESAESAGNINKNVILVGDTLILPCPIFTESSKFGWQKDRVPIAYGPPDTISISDGRISLDDSIYGWRKLIITQIQHRDAGEYLCVVERSFANPFKLITEVQVITEDEIETTSGAVTTESVYSIATTESVKSTVKNTTPQNRSGFNTPSSGTADNRNSAPEKTFNSRGLIIGMQIIYILMISSP